MSTEAKRYTGGCLCGALRYEAFGEPIGSGHCYCADCRRASGSGLVPFMGFEADSVRFTGEARQSNRKRQTAATPCETDAPYALAGVRRRNGKSGSYTLDAGSLDDPSAFHPTFAIFAQGRPPWAIIPPGLKVFDRMPPTTADTENVG